MLIPMKHQNLFKKIKKYLVPNATILSMNYIISQAGMLESIKLLKRNLMKQNTVSKYFQ